VGIHKNNEEESDQEEICSVHDDEISVSDESSIESAEQSQGGDVEEYESDDDDDSVHKEHSLVEANECTAMSLTSTTYSALETTVKMRSLQRIWQSQRILGWRN
jgi:hypothetical protein